VPEKLAACSRPLQAIRKAAILEPSAKGTRMRRQLEELPERRDAWRRVLTCSRVRSSSASGGENRARFQVVAREIHGRRSKLTLAVRGESRADHQAIAHAE